MSYLYRSFNLGQLNPCIKHLSLIFRGILEKLLKSPFMSVLAFIIPLLDLKLPHWVVIRSRCRRDSLSTSDFSPATF